MRILNKWIIVILIFLFAAGSLTTLNSCRYSTYKNYHKIQKLRRLNRTGGYHSAYQKKLRRNSVPIHRNYVIKNQRRTSGYNYF